MKKSGFSIIEVLVVTALISILSVGAFFSFSSYAQHVDREKAATELITILQNAKSKSIAGELRPTPDLSDFDLTNYSTSLPEYSVEIDVSNNQYRMIRTYVDSMHTPRTELVGIQDCPKISSDTQWCVLDTKLTVSGSTVIKFTRSTGATTASTIYMKKGSVTQKTITVSANGNITSI